MECQKLYPMPYLCRGRKHVYLCVICISSIDSIFFCQALFYLQTWEDMVTHCPTLFFFPPRPGIFRSIFMQMWIVIGFDIHRNAQRHFLSNSSGECHHGCLANESRDKDEKVASIWRKMLLMAHTRLVYRAWPVLLCVICELNNSNILICLQSS